MLSIALRSRWGIPAFVASMAIELLQFLSLTAILSASACLVWGFTFLIDIILMDFLRQDRKPKTHKLRFSDAEEECVHDEAFVHHIRAEIDMYLSHDNSSAEWTAVALDMMLPAREHLRSPDRPVESSVCFVWRLWEIFVYFACQIPHNHLYQDKLVALVVALSKRPTVLVRDRDRLFRFWDAVPLYDSFVCLCGGMIFCNESWRHDGEEVPRHNLMAFLARMQATGLPYGAMFGSNYSLHTALNEKRLDTLPWAACWIELCGEYLWWYVSQESNNGVIFTMQMWIHYMAQFRKIACDGQNGRYVRLLAHDSFRTMARLTNSVPNPKFNDMGKKRWQAILAREGPYGVFTEPIAPDSFREEGYEVFVEDDEWEDNALYPDGGYMPYSNVTEADEHVIARAA